MLRSQRGSALIFTLILAIIVCSAAAAYLRTVMLETRLSTSSLNLNRALHLAEAGIDEALLALNNATSGSWSSAGIDAISHTIEHRSDGTPIQLGGGATGTIKIRIDDPTGEHPVVIAEGIVDHPIAGKVKRQVKVEITRTVESGAGISASDDGGGVGMGLVSKNNIVMNNSAYVDSFDSDVGPWNLNTNRGDKILVASVSGNIQIQNSNIFGQTAVGGGSKNAVSVTQGSLTNGETSAGTRFDQNLITTNVSINLPAAPASPTNSGATAGQALPQNIPNGVTTLGSPGATTPTYYYTTGQNVNLSGNAAFKIVGPVVLVVNGQLSLNGDGIQVEDSGNASLRLYVSGNINANGNGNTPAFNNKTGKANNLVIIANGAAGQNLAVNGAGNSTFAFYGPSYNVNVNGNGHISGSIVANYISLGGSFHYDHRVDPLAPGTRRENALTSEDIVRYQVTTWRELTGRGANYARDTAAPFN